MGTRDDYEYLPLRDALKAVSQKVKLIGVILDFGFPKKSNGTDYCCCLRLIDETHHQMTVNIFTENVEKLPRLAALGDVIVLCRVQVKSYGEEGEVNAVFYKNFSSFALYKGKDGDDFNPYQVSSNFHTRNEDRKLIVKLRKFLVNFQLHEDLGSFPMLREIKEEKSINLACKILHCYEAAKNEWFIFVWDGTNTPPNAIHSRLEDEINSPLPLQLEPLPLSRELLCGLPTVGSILRITFDQGVEKNHLHLLNVGKWVKFINMHLEVDGGLWHGVFTPRTKLRHTPIEDNLIVERQRLSDERLFPKPSFITEDVNQDHATTPVTLMSVLTHSEVTARFKCVVRVVAAMPCQAENLFSPTGIYRMRLTLEDSTARIHAFVTAKDGETLFDGYPDTDELRWKLNRLLGVNSINDTPRNPPWICVCLKSYCDVWGNRYFKIFDNKIVGDA